MIRQYPRECYHGMYSMRALGEWDLGHIEEKFAFLYTSLFILACYHVRSALMIS